MLKTYFKIALRNISGNSVYSTINIAGLAVGIACVILISLYIQDELRFDRFFRDADRIYQVNLNGNFDGTDFTTANSPPTVGPALLASFPEIESYTRIYRPGNTVVRNDGKAAENYFTENRIFGVDSNFLQVFSYEMIAGDPASCLLHPNSIVITEQVAKKYFGEQQAMGERLLLGNDKTPYAVTGILKDIPGTSSFEFDFLTPIAAHPAVKQFSWSWVWLQVNTYVKLRENFPNDAQHLAKLEAAFPAMVKTQAATAFKRIGQPMDEFLKKGGKWDFHLQPMRDVHLHSRDISGRITNLGDIKYIYIFSAIALFIIILACVNFMNLSTAQASRRAKEVGVRKVLGSVKSQLMKQFLAEAMLYSFISTFIAVLLVAVAIKPFDALAGKSLDFSLLFTNGIWIFLIGLTLLTGLLAGSYPAFYLSSFRPIAVLKNVKSSHLNRGSRFIRNGLVVLQFTVSTVLIICTLVVFRQLQFTQNKNIGWDRENVIAISNSNRLAASEETFRQELTTLPGVITASISTSIPTKDNFGDYYEPEISATDKDIAKGISINSFMVDENFVPALQIELLEGRNFSRDFSDSGSVILNEAAVKQIGWKDPVGKFMNYPGNGNQRFRVIGVAKDFNIESIRYSVAPFALFHASSKTYQLSSSYVIARIRAGEMESTLDKIKNKWTAFSPDSPFDHTFLDTEYEAQYRSEQRMSAVFTLFTVLSLFIACLGLFGLSAYTAERRTKEIGIRKVLGATASGVVALLSKEFARLVILSVVVAFPIAWWAMNKWLEDFAFRITISWWIFAVAGLAALTIALITVSFQSIKAAIMNPVKSLRME
ncbi:MAG TPA: ABC transporter permease [Chitinophagales bacterium]|nr:ABC transporter permease [Chitinophagales bacterium]